MDDTESHLSQIVSRSLYAGRARRVMGNGTDGVWVGTVFTPETGAFPATMFAPQRGMPSTPLPRFVLQHHHPFGGFETMLVSTDGSCLGNGRAGARAGWAFIFRPGPEGVVSGALEQQGPDGEWHGATSNRAELRAVIAALEFRAWWAEGWERIVIATDSEYVANGATEWLRRWAACGWRTARGLPVQNRDLWERLSERMGMCAKGGCEVSFWWVPRALNAEADRAAKAAAEDGRIEVEYTTQLSMAV